VGLASLGFKIEYVGFVGKHDMLGLVLKQSIGMNYASKLPS